MFNHSIAALSLNLHACCTQTYMLLLYITLQPKDSGCIASNSSPAQQCVSTPATSGPKPPAFDVTPNIQYTTPFTLASIGMTRTCQLTAVDYFQGKRLAQQQEVIG